MVYVRFGKTNPPPHWIRTAVIEKESTHAFRTILSRAEERNCRHRCQGNRREIRHADLRPMMPRKIAERN